MTNEEINALFARLIDLPVDSQSNILAGIYGGLEYHAKNGSKIAKKQLNIIEKKVTEYENKNSAK